ncbi:MAG: gamma-glutamylcyclotransferase [Candidatus Pelagibacterales bacterium]|nr:MAG: gamma-glutamylcyclotransferase [Pelagibacterales bacterium]
MLYFAFGSNLNRKQMKRRCKDSKYIGCFTLKNYKLVFRNEYYGGGVADVERKKNSNVLGAIYKISKSDEKVLDVYEDFPTMYIKKYFKLFGKKVMFYYMPKKTKYNPPAKIYLNKIIQGYKDCGYKNSYIMISRNKKIKIR